MGIFLNILVIGNGFDLSHFLPTKYDHFMYAMKSIQKYRQPENGMSFDEIFIELPENEIPFISKTKEIYDCTNIRLNQEQILFFQNKLATNNWFEFFLNHVNEIKSWIDFEQKIEQALNFSVNAINIINDRHLKEKTFNLPIYNFKRDNSTSYFFTDLQFNILSFLNFITLENVQIANGGRRAKLNSQFFISQEYDLHGFNSTKFISFLQDQLEEFIEIFNLYLTVVIDVLEPHSRFNVDELKSVNKVFSFNYTNTFEKFYKNDIDIQYLHGKFGSEQNLVLGVSDIKDVSLKNLKAYGFTKYHQKILKDTQYKFLNVDITENKSYLKALEEAKTMRAACANNHAYFQSYSKECERIESKIKSKNTNFLIWGHSLDISDEVYINEIFSFNETIDNNVRVIVFHYDQKTKAELLTNLFHILGKDKVERWMKEDWLVFKQNPATAAQTEQAVA